MTWEFRYSRKNVEGVELFGLVEVYYDESGKVNGYTDWIDPNGWDNIEDLKITLEHMVKAMSKPEFIPEEK